ncbi:class I SAM-dependent methyltransferase [Arenibaculum sp.]|jgi:SAM-dependent methyltransferase|uniref:class I SAM-dependent methyltransferase n=1 Tax=Arenibaculum sp. TaxID=2865862 RepID=UPI002E0F19E1|nr:class I SAM-dependent methyltransferase [Arenibaculum sp.]
MNEAASVRWVSGDLYEPYVGRWSRLVAREFLNWLDAPARLDWLDLGCGTGVVLEAIAGRCAPAHLAGVDSSAGFLDFARLRLKDTGAELHRADARGLPFAAARFDRVVSGLMLNFVPDQPLAAAEMARVAQPGGEVALYVWDYAEGMEMMRRFWDAAAALDPQAAERDEARRSPICRPEPLRRLFEGAGLTEVETRAIDVPTAFRDFDDYWVPFLGGQAPAPAYCMSLTEEGRTALRERLRASLPAQADGSIRLVARAWAVRGRKA